MKRNVSVVCVYSAPNCCDMERLSASNILISGKIVKEMSGSVASGTPCTILGGSEGRCKEDPVRSKGLCVI